VGTHYDHAETADELLGVEALENRELLSTTTTLKLLNREQSDSTLAGTLTAAGLSGAITARSTSRPRRGRTSRGLITEGGSGQKRGAWYNTSQQANIQVAASVFVNSLVPSCCSPAAPIWRAMPRITTPSRSNAASVSSWRVVDGVETTLAQVRTQDYFSNRWLR
jgi:hypothetical protein